MSEQLQALTDILQNQFGIRVNTEEAQHLIKQARRKGTGGYVQWMSSDGRIFAPASQTYGKLSPGVYVIGVDFNSGLFFDKIPVSTEGLVRLPDTNGDKVIDEIRKFWDKEEVFRKHRLAYKRGVFMHGPPGSGKSCTIRIVSQDVVERGGVVIKFGDPGETARGLRILREIQPDTPVVVLMEDLDSIINRYMESEVINLLDGIDGVDKVIFLATSNYPEQLGERIVNRPSRFDRRYYIGPPNAESRKLYFTFLFATGGEDPKRMALARVNRWVQDTDGMSIAHLKELFIAVEILGTPYEDALETLRSMEILPNSKEYKGDDCDCVTDSGAKVQGATVAPPSRLGENG